MGSLMSVKAQEGTRRRSKAEALHTFTRSLPMDRDDARRLPLPIDEHSNHAQSLGNERGPFGDESYEYELSDPSARPQDDHNACILLNKWLLLVFFASWALSTTCLCSSFCVHVCPTRSHFGLKKCSNHSLSRIEAFRSFGSVVAHRLSMLGSLLMMRSLTN